MALDNGRFRLDLRDLYSPPMGAPPAQVARWRVAFSGAGGAPSVDRVSSETMRVISSDDGQDSLEFEPRDAGEFDPVLEFKTTEIESLARISTIHIQTIDGPLLIAVKGSGGEFILKVDDPPLPRPSDTGRLWKRLLDRYSGSLIAPARGLMFELDSKFSTRVTDHLLREKEVGHVRDKLLAALRLREDTKTRATLPFAKSGMKLTSALVEEFSVLADEQFEIYQRPNFEPTFEAFANGDLRFEEVPELCEPDSENFMLFGEFALAWLCLVDANCIKPSSIEQSSWLRWARLFVRTQRVFIEVYGPCGCGTQGSPITLKQYGPQNYRMWRRWSEKRIMDLRMEFESKDVNALGEAMLSNVEYAGHPAGCLPDLPASCKKSS